MNYTFIFSFFIFNFNLCCSQINDVKLDKVSSIVWYGESTTRGTGVRKEMPWRAFMWRVSDFLNKNSDHKIKNINLGFPGWSSSNALENIEVLLKEDFDCVFLEFALNDTGLEPKLIEENLIRIIDKIKIKNKDCKIYLILLNKTVSLNRRVKNEPDKVTIAWNNVSNEMKIPLIDIGASLINLSTDNILFDKMIPDGTHPNEFGHFVYSSIIINNLQRPEYALFKEK